MFPLSSPLLRHVKEPLCAVHASLLAGHAMKPAGLRTHRVHAEKQEDPTLLPVRGIDLGIPSLLSQLASTASESTGIHFRERPQRSNTSLLTFSRPQREAQTKISGLEGSAHR